LTSKSASGRRLKQDRERFTETKSRETPAPVWKMEEIDVKVDELPDGVKMCLSNSRDFLTEAEILAKKGHFRHAVGLLELGYEEMGKAQHILDAFEDATLAGRRTARLAEGMFRKHLIKLASTPQPWVISYSEKEYDLRRRFCLFGPSLREKSFYVDLRQGEWLWGNPEFEREETIAFLVKESRIDCEAMEAWLNTALIAKKMIKKYGLDDKRTQEFIRKHFGRPLWRIKGTKRALNSQRPKTSAMSFTNSKAEKYL